ncbi:glutamyl-tRNA reductase [Candidatus Berkiella aquae]|uniref:Glutamyl-tRNA reductase n=1 Tax=Candidatus Berkiella aquae TaxID=295108 RepID=A0AAE3HU71_9GAMM|nr:glutamyl-tRNA reductase [Candidatus Berkiella aquae]MCS5710698.1 glutamyl-tRNA reductase [Candidatus Berkiella aquae]
MLLTLGISHKTAPIDVREKLAFTQENIPGVLAALYGEIALEEVALLSTCNRTEFYFSTQNQANTSFRQLQSWWKNYLTPQFDMTPYLYMYTEEHAVRHVMRLACGLDSMVIGEPQILGQLKIAYQTASQSGVVGRTLSRLFQTSFSVAKKIRTQTGIASHPVSIAYAATTLAKQIFCDLSQATVVLIGAGENIELTLQHLLAKQVKRIIIANRTVSHAKALAERYGAMAVGLNELGWCLQQADIVISSIASPKPVVTKTHVEQAFTKRRPLFMVDLGVPRNIEPDLAHSEDIYLYTVDDLQGYVNENLKTRQNAAKDAEVLIEHASGAYMEWMSAQAQLATVRQLRLKAQDIKNHALSAAINRLRRGEAPEKVLTQFAHQLTQKLLHQPTVQLRQASLEQSEEKITVVKELFDLSD